MSIRSTLCHRYSCCRITWKRSKTRRDQAKVNEKLNVAWISSCRERKFRLMKLFLIGQRRTNEIESLIKFVQIWTSVALTLSSSLTHFTFSLPLCILADPKIDRNWINHSWDQYWIPFFYSSFIWISYEAEIARQLFSLTKSKAVSISKSYFWKKSCKNWSN